MNFMAQKDCASFELKDCMTKKGRSQIANDIIDGLSGEEKSVPSKYFYDHKGSKLFEAICKQPEYYVTRTELDILQRFADQMVDGFGNGDLVELGSGANWKIRKLLDAMHPESISSIRYVPVDVSESALESASRELVTIYPDMSVKGVVADFTCDLKELPQGKQKLILFLGSTIGNLDNNASHRFLMSLSEAMEKGDRFVLGVDLVKPKEILERAYNDKKGVTREFNKNVLRVINRELNADFDFNGFEHQAYYNESESRIEMRLRSLTDQEVQIESLNMTVPFREGETILTEICRKFTHESLRGMIHKAGMRIRNWFTDQKEYFLHAEIVKA